MKTKTSIFIIIESIIYITFIILDILRIDSSYLKYLGIVLCLLYSLLNKNIIISIAMFFTLISDYFLLLTNDHIIMGLFTFILVQSIYWFYLYKQKCDSFTLIRIIIYALIIFILSIYKYDILYILALLYFSTLIMNVISSYTNKKLIILSIGLTLFVGCDICVGIHNIASAELLYEIATFGMWVFYLPSQVLINIGANINN